VEPGAAGPPADTREVFERVTLSDDFSPFLTFVAYERLGD
jgi:hypothetical protein